jgi:hypothetical protein
MINKRSHGDGDTMMKKYRIQRRIPNKRKLDDNLILLPRSQGRNRSLYKTARHSVSSFHRQEHSQAAELIHYSQSTLRGTDSSTVKNSRSVVSSFFDQSKKRQNHENEPAIDRFFRSLSNARETAKKESDFVRFRSRDRKVKRT